MDEQILGSWRKKRSWKSSGRLQISPHCHEWANIRQLTQKKGSWKSSGRLQISLHCHGWVNIRQLTQKRSWKSSGRLQISPSSHTRRSTNMRQLMENDPEYLQMDNRFHQAVMDEQIWGKWSKKDPENLQIDYRFQASNLIFKPPYKENENNAWCIHHVCASVCDGQ